MKAFNIKVLLLLSLGHLVTDIYQGALPTLLPFLKENLSLSYAMTGVILMTGNFTASLIQPLLGYLSDRQNKPLLLPLGCLGAGVGLSLLSLTSSYVCVLALVAVSGLGAASYHPEGYKTAHFFTGEKRVTGMAIFSVGGNLGFALGPLIVVYTIERLGFASLPIIVIPCLIFTFLILFYWRVVTVPQRSAPKGQQPVPAPLPIEGARFSLLMIIGFVMIRSWMQAGLMTYIPFYYINHLGGDPLYAGQLVFVLLAGSAVGTVGVSPLADKVGCQRYLILSMLLATAIAPLFFLVDGVLLFVVLGVLGLLVGSTFSVTIVMAQHLLPRNLGVASGLIVGFAIGAGGICVALLGVLADHFGVPLTLKSVFILPLIGLLLTLKMRYPDHAPKA